MHFSTLYARFEFTIGVANFSFNRDLHGAYLKRKVRKIFEASGVCPLIEARKKLKKSYF